MCFVSPLFEEHGHMVYIVITLKSFTIILTKKKQQLENPPRGRAVYSWSSAMWIHPLSSNEVQLSAPD